MFLAKFPSSFGLGNFEKPFKKPLFQAAEHNINYFPVSLEVY